MIDLNEARWNGSQPLPTQNEKLQFPALVKSLPTGRSYALDPSLRAGTSLSRSLRALNEGAQPQREQVVALLARVAEFEPTLTQSWRGAPASPLPELWLNPLTGEPLPNPFAKPVDLRGQSVLLQCDPALADLFKRLAADPYETVLTMREEEAKREQLAKIQYTERDHRDNVYRSTEPNASQAQGIFRQTQGAMVAEIWKWEAQPVALPWAANAIHRSKCAA